MAHTITTQVLEDGTRNTCIKVNIKGDNLTATELVKAVIFDASSYKTESVENKLMMIQFCLNGFSAELFWDAGTDIPLINLDSDISETMDYSHCGGLINNSTTNKTGDILITTTGLASSVKDGYIIFHIKERAVPIIR